MRFFSQIGQDKIVVTALASQKDGFFVDIGCGFPSDINNTYALEKYLNWQGISIDLEDQMNVGYDKDLKGKSWDDLRKTPRIIHDALKINYVDLFRQYNLPKEIDYLSMDLEPPDLTLECLYKIPFDLYKFKIISFETDEYKTSSSDLGGEIRKQKSSEYLKSLGYVLFHSIKRQDDFYIRNDLFDSIKNIDFNNISWQESVLYK